VSGATNQPNQPIGQKTNTQLTFMFGLSIDHSFIHPSIHPSIHSFIHSLLSQQTEVATESKPNHLSIHLSLDITVVHGMAWHGMGIYWAIQ
jgi:hypothetical protein